MIQNLEKEAVEDSQVPFHEDGQMHFSVLLGLLRIHVYRTYTQQDQAMEVDGEENRTLTSTPLPCKRAASRKYLAPIFACKGFPIRSQLFNLLSLSAHA